MSPFVSPRSARKRTKVPFELPTSVRWILPSEPFAMRRSQTALSRRLGYRTNVVYAWESGRRFPTTATLFRGMAKLGIDVRKLVKSFFATPPAWLDDIQISSPEGIARLLEELRGNTPIVE